MNHKLTPNSRQSFSSLPMSKKLLPLMIAAALQPNLSFALDANALPTGGAIVAGQGAIAQQGNAMTVTQSTQQMIANWNTFNVGSNAAVNFVQPSASAVVLNNVLSGSGPSLIDGRINANGQVMIVNPSGVVFSNGARVDVGGLVASGQNVSDADFAAGNMRFMNTNQGGSVINQGQINAKEGGYVALVGATVNNSGQITAPGGTVALAAGQNVRLEITGNSLVGVQVDGAAVNASIDNSGVIAADGGKVIISSKQAAGALSAAINQTGTIRANSISTKNGEIWLDGGAGAVNVAGSVEAKGVNAGETGGKVVVTGGDVAVTGSVDASGAAGGGQVYVGGGWQGKDPAINEAKTVTIAKDALVKADATANGNGGTVVAWSADHTNVQGTISAKGAGAGKGGNVETSSHNLLGVSGKIDVGAGGNWLLDPTNIEVNLVGGGDNVQASTIETTLNNGGNVTLTATNNITIAADISKTQDTGNDGSKLILDAGNNITLNGKISSTSNALSIDFGTSTNNSGTTEIIGSVSTNGGNVTFFNSAKISSAETTPISTSLITNGATGASGNIVFMKDVALNNSNSASVTLSTQSAKSGSTYTGTGGDVIFRGNITSTDPLLPQTLVINTTGSTSAGTNQAGIVVFGDASTDVVGSSTNPLAALQIIGPTYTYLNAGAVNLKSQSGNTLTFATNHTSYVPTLVLGSADTTITVTGIASGNGVDSADYTQTTFDIVRGSSIGSVSANLTIKSDRSILLTDHKISGDVVNNGLTFSSDGTFGKTGIGVTSGTASLNTVMYASQYTGISSGSIALNNATINSFGGVVTLGDASHIAYGVASEQNTDGVRLLDSTINTAGGQVTLYGQAPTQTNLGAVSTVGGIGVHLYGATTINAAAGGIDIVGTVATKSSSAAKDGVVIGRGGAATVTLDTTTGAIRILGDASSVTGATSGASYDGVELSAAAMIRSTTGNITIQGFGGGGSKDTNARFASANSNVGENYGVKLLGEDTQIVSQTGNIAITGVSGGKSTSYGIYASGDSMALGQERQTDISKTVESTRLFKGNITLTASTLKVVNTGDTRLRAMSVRSGIDDTTGQLNIQSYYADTNIQLGGTEPARNTTNDSNSTLFIASNLFSGSTAAFIEGFGDISIGHRTISAGIANGAPVGVLATADGTGRLTVAGATRVYDNLNLMMGDNNTGTGGNIVIDAPLTVLSSDSVDRTLMLSANAGALMTATTGKTGSIRVANLQLLGSGDFELNSPTNSNQIATLSANLFTGNLWLNNAQNLTVGSTTSTAWGSTTVVEGVNKTRTTEGGVNTASAIANNVTIALSAGNLTIAKDILTSAASGTTVALVATAGKVDETASAIIVTDKLAVAARDTSSLLSDNLIGTLAANITGSGQGIKVKDNAGGLIVGSVTYESYSDATVIAKSESPNANI
jgi:filamentous hemagglutinin family protein